MSVLFSTVPELVLRHVRFIDILVLSSWYMSKILGGDEGEGPLINFLEDKIL
jgi:hypothetical protein